MLFIHMTGLFHRSPYGLTVHLQNLTHSSKHFLDIKSLGCLLLSLFLVVLFAHYLFCIYVSDCFCFFGFFWLYCDFWVYFLSTFKPYFKLVRNYRIHHASSWENLHWRASINTYYLVGLNGLCRCNGLSLRCFSMSCVKLKWWSLAGGIVLGVCGTFRSQGHRPLRVSLWGS